MSLGSRPAAPEWPFDEEDAVVADPVVAGRLMLTIAVLGVVVAVVGTAVAWQAAGDIDRGAGDSLELTAVVLDTIDESFVVAEDTLTILDDGVGEAEAAVRALGRSMTEGQDALASATDLTGGEVADALESVERSLPAIETAADAIDTALGALSALPFGLDYGTDEGLADGIAQLRDDLDGLPEELRDQAAQVERTSTELTAAAEGTVATADRLVELGERLAEARQLVADFGLSTTDARELVDTQRAALRTSTTRVRLVALAFGLVFALSQFVPYHLGTGLLRSARGAA